MAVDGRGDPLNRHNGVSSDVSHLLDDAVGSPTQVGDFLEVVGLHLERPVVDCDGGSSVKVSRRSQRLDRRHLLDANPESGSRPFGHYTFYLIRLNLTLSCRVRGKKSRIRARSRGNFFSLPKVKRSTFAMRGLTVMSTGDTTWPLAHWLESDRD